MTHDATHPAAPFELPGRQVSWVGEWRVDPELNQISRGAQRLRLEPKAMAVLVYLADRPMQVISREELLAAVWPRVVVGDNALTQVIIKLRRALGDTSKDPAYLQSIAKKGYRLTAEVRYAMPERGRVVAEIAGSQTGLGRLAATRESQASRYAAAIALAVLCAALCAVLWQRTSADKSQALSARDVSTRAPATVLVKPFEVIGGGQARLAVVARAINADLATDLSKVTGLWIVGDSSQKQTMHTQERVRPRYVLSGTVQQESERLRLNVTLTDADADRPLWSERFDRDLSDQFGVQDSLVKSILEVLPVKVGEAERMRVAQRSTRNLDAYDSFVRAQRALLVRRPDQNEAARALYWEAIGRDPAFARAYAGIALTYALDYQQGWAKAGNAALSQAVEFAEASIRMRPDMPEAHWVLAFVAAQRRMHNEALTRLDTALRLDPSYADAYALKGGIYTYVGEPAKSIAELQVALSLNPGAGSLYMLLLGRAHFFLGDNEQAHFYLERALERNPENLEARIYLAATSWRDGDRSAAQWQVSEIRSLDASFNIDAWLDAYPLTDQRKKDQLRTAMLELGF